MRIGQIIGAKRPVFSVEFFPPKTDEGRAQLFDTARQLAELELDFVSVTYGAGGSTREGTVDITTALKDEVGLEVMAHLSCVGETADGLDATLERLRDAGRGPSHAACGRSWCRVSRDLADWRQRASLRDIAGRRPRSIRIDRGVRRSGPLRGSRKARGPESRGGVPRPSWRRRRAGLRGWGTGH